MVRTEPEHVLREPDDTGLAEDESGEGQDDAEDRLPHVVRPETLALELTMLEKELIDAQQDEESEDDERHTT